MKAAGWAKLRHAKISGDAERIKKCASDSISFCDSEDRLVYMLKAIADQPPEIFWPLWLDHWSAIDHCADLHWHVHNVLKSKGSAQPYLDEESMARFLALPKTVTVYRGCDREHIDGVAWTTSKQVAGYFATGGRYGRPDDPVIATGKIEKCSPDFFFPSGSEQGEQEIVCSPKVIRVEEYTGPFVGEAA
ncbi:MAG: hypothetical protein WB689_30385 [Xanthobacteraceae bacterium]